MRWRLLAACLAVMPGCGVDAQLARANKALEASDLDRAEERFRRVLDSAPDSVDALYGLGWAYHLGGQSERAREYFVRCRRVNPEDHRGEKGLGSIALAEGNLVLAEQHFRSAMAMAPDEPAIVNSLALTHMAGKRFEKAMLLLEPLVESMPGRGEYRLNLAETLYRLSRYEEALAAVDKALDLEIKERRFVVLLLQLRARVLLAMTSGRLNPEDCENTLPPILAWLERAGTDLDRAEAVGIASMEIMQVRHKLHRRRNILAETCPGISFPK